MLAELRISISGQSFAFSSGVLMYMVTPKETEVGDIQWSTVLSLLLEG